MIQLIQLIREARNQMMEAGLNSDETRRLLGGESIRRNFSILHDARTFAAGMRAINLKVEQENYVNDYRVWVKL